MSSFHCVSTVTAIVVTFNRRSLLERCLLSISGQAVPADRILIVDNASADGTAAWLGDWLPENLPQAKLIALSENLGGAGGFAEGLRAAVADGADWIWMMDDDAAPHPDALQELMRVATDPSSIYGSIAVCGRQTSWPVHGTDGRQYLEVEDLPERFEVGSLPFLGFLVSAQTLARIGYPDAGYFIAGDDHEYCMRAKANGIPIIACGGSLIEHPSSCHYQFGFGRFRPTCFYIQPWKRYYDVRNRIMSAARHDGAWSAWSRTVPATLVRWLATMIHEPDRIAQTRAYVAGLIDGVRGRSGRRHGLWGF